MNLESDHGVRYNISDVRTEQCGRARECLQEESGFLVSFQNKVSLICWIVILKENSQLTHGLAV